MTERSTPANPRSKTTPHPKRTLRDIIGETYYLDGPKQIATFFGFRLEDMTREDLIAVIRFAKEDYDHKLEQAENSQREWMHTTLEIAETAKRATDHGGRSSSE